MDRWLKTGSLKKACNNSTVLFTNDKQIVIVNDNGCIENSDDLPVNRKPLYRPVTLCIVPTNVVLNASMTKTF